LTLRVVSVSALPAGSCGPSRDHLRLRWRYACALRAVSVSTFHSSLIQPRAWALTPPVFEAEVAFIWLERLISPRGSGCSSSLSYLRELVVENRAATKSTFILSEDHRPLYLLKAHTSARRHIATAVRQRKRLKAKPMSGDRWWATGVVTW
jgi:hypothetical protein